MTMYNEIHTAFDMMKEYLIAGAELEPEYGIPILPAVNLRPEDTVDFSESFSRKLKNHRKLNVNFYIDDQAFQRFWNQPDKYLEHLKCFHSVTTPDFSIAVGNGGMPFALNLFNHYRNHALGWFLHKQGIKVIPSVSIPDEENYDWCFSGLPKNSTLSVCTNGRVRAKAARLEFCQGFHEMCERLEPIRVIVVGKVPEELNSPVEIINLQTRNQKMNERYGNQNGNKDKQIQEEN